jgi:hypothetical protein
LPISLTRGAAQLPGFAGIALAALLIATSGCSPEAGAPREAKTRETSATSMPASVAATPKPSAATPRTSGEMQRDALAREGVTPAPASALVTDRRCGWLTNPTPGNWWLFDGHGEWILSTQGGPQAQGFDDMPDMSLAGWVETNGHYGYGCACMTLTYQPGTLQVARIAAVKAKPLGQCRADRRLPRP